MDIPLKNAQVIWDYVGEEPDVDPIRVVGVSSADDESYLNSWGACKLEFNEADAGGQLAMLFTLFAHLTIDEGLDPKSVEDALIVIPEFREVRSRMR